MAATPFMLLKRRFNEQNVTLAETGGVFLFKNITFCKFEL
jgi:hypothetical protein